VNRLADLIAQVGPAFLAHMGARIRPHQAKAIRDIMRCRTPAMGAGLYRCDNCGHRHTAYHSCNNRACPRCGGESTHKWLQARLRESLPVRYAFATFTLPPSFIPLFRMWPRRMPDLFFKCAFQALQEVAGTRLKARIGALAVFHPNGRRLQSHPHIHFIVPAGGLSHDRSRWIRARSPNWFLGARAVAARFKGLMWNAVRKLPSDAFRRIHRRDWGIGWNVDVRSAGSGMNVLKYLARYVKRTAIGDKRIVHADTSTVAFRYDDHETGRPCVLTLPTFEFLERYIVHAPLPGEHRVRYFGWWAPAAARTRAHIVRLLADSSHKHPEAAGPAPSPPSRACLCPRCHKLALVRIASLPRGPPITCVA
jgi:hypothetical protein